MTQQIKRLIIISVLFFFILNCNSQDNNYLETNNSKIKLDSVINQKSELIGFKLNKCKEEKIGIPEYYDDLYVQSLTGSLNIYYDYIKVDSIIVDKDLGYIDYENTNEEKILQLKIYLNNEIRPISKLSLYLIYDTTKRFEVEFTQDAVDILKRFGKPKMIIVDNITYMNSNYKEWSLPNTILWRIK